MTSNEETVDSEESVNVEIEQFEGLEAGSDEEDDCEGYFLEPSANAVNIAERIAEANRKLFEEESNFEDNESRPRRVQFSDNLVDYEPEGDYSDEEFVESGGNSSNSEEDSEKKKNNENLEKDENRPLKRLDRPKTANKDFRNRTCETIEESDSEQTKKNGDEKVEEIADEIDEDVVVPGDKSDETENVDVDDKDLCQGNNSKLLLVLLPREQSSSCESVIGEDIIDEENADKKENVGNDVKPFVDLEEGTEQKVKKEDEHEEEKTESSETSKSAKVNPRPKSAKSSKSHKNKAPKTCKLSKISPDLNYSHDEESKKWHESRSHKIRSKSQTLYDESKGKSKENKVKRIEADVEPESLDEKNKNGKVNIVYQNLDPPKNKRKPEEVLRETKTNQKSRPKSSYIKDRPKELGPSRPKTAPAKRACCIIRKDLPQYNGLRSEYGLSAEQLQERRRRTFEVKQQKRLDRVHKKQEEIQRRLENEERFSQWLHSKSRRSRGTNSVSKRSSKISGHIDTLSRSDVYIQNHAVYASRRGISYSVDYSINKKTFAKNVRLSLDGRKNERTINLEKLFDNVSPHVKRTYRIYLGLEPGK